MDENENVRHLKVHPLHVAGKKEGVDIEYHFKEKKL